MLPQALLYSSKKASNSRIFPTTATTKTIENMPSPTIKASKTEEFGLFLIAFEVYSKTFTYTHHLQS